MQMYRVKFARRIIGDVVDLGDMLVCAGSQETARDAIAALTGIGISGVEWDVARVKPSIYQISRREVRHSLPTVTTDIVDAHCASSATFPGVTENQPEEYWHSVQAVANIRAEHEESAVAKLSVALAREMAGEKQKASCRDLEIRCDRTELHPRAPATDLQAIYTDIKILHGGAGRPR